MIKKDGDFMDWGRVALHLLVMGLAYGVGYISSYAYSKKYAEKRIKEVMNKHEKERKEK